LHPNGIFGFRRAAIIRRRAIRFCLAYDSASSLNLSTIRNDAALNHEFGIGLTDLVKRPTKTIEEL